MRFGFDLGYFSLKFVILGGNYEMGLLIFCAGECLVAEKIGENEIWMLIVYVELKISQL